jgi:uncharacterized protein (TIGR03437 family)
MRRSCLLKYSIGCCVVVVLIADRASAENRPAELQKACDGGNAQDCKTLGDMYQRSHLGEAGVKAPALYQKALPFYQKACDGGDAKLCGELGDMYASGLGVPSDMPKAVQLWQNACDAGNAAGCHALGSMYHDGGLHPDIQLNGTQVLLGDQPLPILYTSAGQLNVQVPYGVPVNTQYQLTVQHGNTLSVPQSLVVAQAQPGIFTVNQQGTGQGSIVKSDQVTLAQPGTPASIGETVVIYCTGLGAVTPAVKEGQPAPTTPPLSTTVNAVTVTIGGQAAFVAFSGLTPGYAGLYQVNAVVPAGITTGDAVPVVLSVAGQTSPAVTIAVR